MEPVEQHVGKEPADGVQCEPLLRVLAFRMQKEQEQQPEGESLLSELSVTCTNLAATEVNGASEDAQPSCRETRGLERPALFPYFEASPGVLPSRGEANQPRGIWALARDLTERKRAEAALRENEERLRLILEANSEGVWDWNLPGGRAYFSSGYSRMLGYEPDEFAKDYTAWKALVHPDDFERVHQAHEEHINEGKELCIEFRMRKKPGDWCWIRSRGVVVERDADGHALRMVGTHLDITERKRAEQALLESGERLRIAAEEIKQLKDRLQAESDYLRAEISTGQAHSKILGRSRGIRRVLQQVEQVAPADCPVLVSGETGTGKEIIAQEIHRLSARKGRVMVLVNCAALPSALVESELFGRERGAYTGALTAQVGRFEIADGSTIFLDEVGELSSEVQAKLLRVLQEGEFQRLGSPKTHKVNVRVIAATNRDLAEDVRKGRFREDLYYRLNVFPIEIPPLRARAEDIPLLVFAFMEEFAGRMGKKITKINRKAMEVLQGHSWPGNIRELRNVVEHGVILTAGDTLKLTGLGESPSQKTQPMTLADAEREHILKTLEATGWRIKGPYGAAARLDLQPSTLYSRMQKLGIPHRRQKDSLGV